MSQSASELIEMIKNRSIKLPEELSVISKWNILQVLIPTLTKDKVKNQKKNYCKLSEDSMLFMCIETIVNLFLFIVWDDGRQNTDPQYVKTRTFHRLIKNVIEENQDLEKEIEKIKEEKGMVDEKYHDEVVREQNKEIKRLTQENEKHSDRLKQQEEFYKDKLLSVEPRLRAKIEMEFQCKYATKSDTHTLPELS